MTNLLGAAGKAGFGAIKKQKKKHDKAVKEKKKEHKKEVAASAKLRVLIIGAKGLKAADRGGTSDPYVTLRVGGVPPANKTEWKTPVVKKTLNPTWNSQFDVPIARLDDWLDVEIWDWDMTSKADPLGEVHLQANKFGPTPIDQWYKIEKGQGEIHLNISYIPPPGGAHGAVGGHGAPAHGAPAHGAPAPQGGYPSGGYPQQGYPPQGYYPPPQQGGYPPQGYPPQSGGYPPQQGGYPPQQGGYPPQSGGYPPQSGGYPPQQGGYPPQQGGYPPQGYYPPPQQGGQPPSQGGHHG